MFCSEIEVFRQKKAHICYVTSGLQAIDVQNRVDDLEKGHEKMFDVKMEIFQKNVIRKFGPFPPNLAPSLRPCVYDALYVA